MAINITNSPYSAAVTGCGFMWEEMTRILPLCLSDNSDELLKAEVAENRYLMIGAQVTRKKAMTEFRRRYASVPRAFWENYLSLEPSAQKIHMFYVMLKSYKLFFDLQTSITMSQWSSIQASLSKVDIMRGIYDIASQDAFVDSWSENTKDRVASAYMATLRHVGILEQKSCTLHAPSHQSSDFFYFLEIGEEWFLDACLLPAYEIESIKQMYKSLQ